MMANERSPRRCTRHPKHARSPAALASRAPKTRDVGMRSAISREHTNAGGANRHRAGRWDWSQIAGLAAALLRCLDQPRVAGLRWARKVR
jgi:hypothetical protein